MEKSVTVFVFIHTHNRLGIGIAFKTTRVKDTHPTLAAVLFQVKVNNSIFFLALQTYKKKFAEFPFLQDLSFLA